MFGFETVLALVDGGIAHRRLYVVRNPFYKVTAVLVLNVEHLLVDFFH